MISLGFREVQWIRLAADYQNSAHDLFFFFFGAILPLGSALELLLSPTTELVVTGCQPKFTFHCTSKSDREIVHWYCMIREDISKRLFLFFIQLMRHLLIELFHPSHLLQMLNNHRMVYVGFFGNFLIICKRISFSDCPQLFIVNFWWLAITSLF